MNDSINDDEDQYKNPRNLCSGSVRQLDSKISAERNLSTFMYHMPEPSKYNLNINLKGDNVYGIQSI